MDLKLQLTRYAEIIVPGHMGKCGEIRGICLGSVLIHLGSNKLILIHSERAFTRRNPSSISRKAQELEVLEYLPRMAANPKVEGSAHHIDFLEAQSTDSLNSNLQNNKNGFLDPESGIGEGLKTTAEHIVLIPQPSDDPQDPLNWTSTKKHALLAIVVACSFLPDYGSVTGAATLAPQAKLVIYPQVVRQVGVEKAMSSNTYPGSTGSCRMKSTIHNRGTSSW